MNSDPDDAALRWDDETDPTHVDAPTRAAREPASEADGGDTEQPAIGSTLLVVYGILAGIYLLFTIGWIFATFRDPVPVSGALAVIMYQFGEMLAITAPLLWASVAWVLTRKSKPILRVLLLIIGIILLVPWPFIVAS